MVNDNIVIIQQRTGFTWKLSEAHVFCKIILLEEMFCQYSLKRGVPSATAGAAPAESRGVLSAQDAPGSDLDPFISEQRQRRLQEHLQWGLQQTQSQGCSAEKGHRNIELKVMAEPCISLLRSALAGFHLQPFWEWLWSCAGAQRRAPGAATSLSQLAK